MGNIKPGCLLSTSYVKTHFLPHRKHNGSNPKTKHSTQTYSLFFFGKNNRHKPIERVDKLQAEKCFNVVVGGTSDIFDSNHKTLVSLFSLLVPLEVQSLC